MSTSRNGKTREESQTRRSPRIRFSVAKYAFVPPPTTSHGGFIRTSRAEGTTIDLQVTKRSRVTVKNEEVDAGEVHTEQASPARKRKHEDADSVALQTTKTEKKAKVTSKYAPPEKYAHLSGLTDQLKEDLDGVSFATGVSCC